MRDERAPGGGAGLVALGAYRCALRLPYVADARIHGDQVGHRVVAVIDDQQFFVGMILVQEQPDGVRHEAPAIRGRHDAGNEGHGLARPGSGHGRPRQAGIDPRLPGALLSRVAPVVGLGVVLAGQRVGLGLHDSQDRRRVT